MRMSGFNQERMTSEVLEYQWEMLVLQLLNLFAPPVEPSALVGSGGKIIYFSGANSAGVS